MIKKDGKEYPVSMLKLYLHDDLLKELDWISNYLKLKNDTQVITVAIHHVYNILKQHDDYLVNGEINENKDSVGKESKLILTGINDEKRSS